MPDDPPKASAAMWTVLFWLALVYFVAWMLAGCGVPCDFEERGGCFHSYGPPVTQAAAQRGLAFADTWWGATIDLRHYEVLFASTPTVRASDGDEVVGYACTRGCSRIGIAADPLVPCGIGYVFVHEVGHVMFPDAPHTDPRFRAVDAMFHFCEEPE